MKGYYIGVIKSNGISVFFLFFKIFFSWGCVMDVLLSIINFD